MTGRVKKSSEKTTYFTDIENPAEMARLMYQDRLVTKQMGGVLRERTLKEISQLRNVLDLACGPGGWVLDLAFLSQKTKVIGVDVSQEMLNFARGQAKAQVLENATFRMMNILRPLDFPANSFDLINARLLFGFMPKESWMPLMRECRRILRPGGVLRLTEMGDSSCSSIACEALSRSFAQALFRVGRSFSPDGYKLGITHMLGRFLTNGGYREISSWAAAVDCSIDSDAYWQFSENFTALYQLVKPFIVGTGVVQEQEYDRLYTQALAEIRQDDFSGISFLLTVSGKKLDREDAKDIEAIQKDE